MCGTACRLLYKLLLIRLAVQCVHLAMAVRAKGDRVRHRILALLGKPSNVMTFEVKPHFACSEKALP